MYSLSLPPLPWCDPQQQRGHAWALIERLAGMQCICCFICVCKLRRTFRAFEGKRAPFELVSLEEEWRYLGMIQNGLGECDKMV
jgi:hypothetical protein